MISLIVAISKNNIIGKNGDLPWHLRSDFKYFIKTTSGHPVIMGANTYFSIDEKFRPLKNRLNIVLARGVDTKFPDKVKVAKSIPEALDYIPVGKEAFVIGGLSIYQQFLKQNLVGKLYITRVEAEVDGDMEFPKVDWDNWKLVSERFNEKGKHDDYDHTFLVYEKR